MPGAVLHTKNAYLVGSLRNDSDQWRIQFFFFGEVKEYVILKPPLPPPVPSVTRFPESVPAKI